MSGTVEPAEAPFTDSRLSIGHLALLIVAGTAVRLAGATGDLWVDEVWSLDNLDVARTIGTWQAWASLYFHDNTHPLNTLYLMLIGPNAPEFHYRLLAVASGAGAVLMAALIGGRDGKRNALLYGAVVALGYPYIHFASEARGYGPMLFAAFLCYWLVQRHLERNDSGLDVAFALIFGLLSHLTFAVAVAGFMAWAAWTHFLRCRRVGDTLKRLALPFAPAVIYLGFYGAIATKSLVIGGSNFQPVAPSIAKLLQSALGMDPETAGSSAILAAAGLVALTGIFHLVRAGRTDWPLFAVVVILCPVAAIAIEIKPYVLPRYFLILLPFATILALRLGCQIANRCGKPGRTIMTALLVCYLTANVDSTARFVAMGRGDYARTLVHIANVSDRPVIVSGRPAFSVGMLVRFQAERLGLEDRIHFEAKPKAPAAWHIRRTDPHRRPDEHLAVDGGNYSLSAIYRYWGLSGDTWALYRLDAE